MAMQQADPKLVAKAAEFIRSRERSKAELVQELTLLQEKVLGLEASQGDGPPSKSIFDANPQEARSSVEAAKTEAGLQQQIQELEARNRELEQATRELEAKLESAQTSTDRQDAREEDRSEETAQLQRRGDDLHQENLRLKKELMDRRVAHDELSQSNRRLRRLVDSSPALIWSFASDHRSAEFNQPFFDFVGENPEDGRSSWQAHIHSDDWESFDETVRHAVENRAPFALEHRLRRGDGSFRWFWTTGAPCLDETCPSGGGARYAGASLDVTTQRETEQSVAEDERRRRNLLRQCWASHEKELLRLHRGLEEFASPLAAASGQLELLSRQVEELKELWRAVDEARTELSAGPSPAALQEEGLERAVSELARQFGARRGAAVHCDADGAIPRLSPESELLIFAALRDLLCLLSKTGETGELRMALGSEQDHLRVTVHGRGFSINGADSAENASQSSLAPIRAQLEPLEGQLRIQEAQEGDVQIELTVPATF